MIGFELRKIFRSKTGIIVALLFIFIIGAMAYTRPAVETENTIISEKTGAEKDKRPALIIANEKFDRKINMLEEVAADKGKESVGISEIAKRNLSNLKFKEYKDVNFYQALSGRVGDSFPMIVMVIIMIMIFTNIYTDEKIAKMDSLILATRNRYKALYAKLSLAVLIPMVLYGFYLLVMYIVTLVQYGKPVNGSLEAFRIVDNGAFLAGSYTIEQYLFIKILTVLVVLVSVAVFASLFSYLSPNSLTSMSAISGFLIIGKLIGVTNLLPKAANALLNKINYVDLVTHIDNQVGIYGGNISILGRNVDTMIFSNYILLGVLVLGILLCTITFRKILTR